MEISNNTLLLILILGILILFICMNCTFTCNSEGFLAGFSDQISNPFAVDYANYPSTADPINIRWGDTKKHVPLVESTQEHQYPGLSGYTERPSCDGPYGNMPRSQYIQSQQ